MARFDPRHMWHSQKIEGDWATIELEFPKEVTLDKIEIHSQHSGRHHSVVAAKVFATDGSKPNLRCEKEDIEPVAPLVFDEIKKMEA